MNGHSSIHLIHGLILCLSLAIVSQLSRQVAEARGHVFTTQDLEKPTRRSLSRLNSMTDTLTGSLGSGLPPIYPSIKVSGGFDDDDEQAEDGLFYEYKRLMLDGHNTEALQKLDRLMLEFVVDDRRMLELCTDRALMLHKLGNNLAALAEAQRAKSLALSLGESWGAISGLIGLIGSELEERFNEN